MMKSRLKYMILVFTVSFFLILIPVVSVNALTQQQLLDLSQNNILFYEPDDECKSTVKYSRDELTWEDLRSLEGNDRLKLVVETYGEYAMQLQKYYGVPWEMPFAQMVFESQVGADHTEESVSYKIEQAGYFNMLGLTGGNGVDHYKSQSYPGYETIDSLGDFHNFAGYDNISKMLLGYTIYHVRNGNMPDEAYDKGLKMLSPDDYRLKEAIPALMYSYCPGGCYQNEIWSIIRSGDTPWTGLLDVVKEKGWKNSEELAKEWNIQPGGIATEKWGWGDIREQIWEEYGENGLPIDAATKFGAAVSTLQSGKVLATSGNAVLHSPTNDWLDGAGLEGYIKDEVDRNANPQIDDSAVVNGQYASFAADAGNGSGLPGFIILHLTAADNFGARSWKNFCGGDFYCPPHFTIDVGKREIFQHFPLSSPSAAVSNRDDGVISDKYGIQVEIVGHGGDSGQTCVEGACGSRYLYTNFSDDDWEYVAKLLIAISNETGIPLTSSVAWANTTSEAGRLMLSTNDLKSYIGVLGHTHINGKWDPLSAWQYIEKALGRLGYAYSKSGFSTCKNPNRRGTCFSLSGSDGGCTKDGYTYYWQGGPSWGGELIAPCETIAGGGCGYSTVAMVVTALTGKQVTPLDTVGIAQRVSSNAFYSCGQGGESGLVAGIIENGNFGLKVEGYNNNEAFTEEVISPMLREGKMIVMSVGSETMAGQNFTSGAHWIAIRGITADGKWKVFSSSPRPSNEVNDMEFEPSEIVTAHVNHRDYWYVVSK